MERSVTWAGSVITAAERGLSPAAALAQLHQLMNRLNRGLDVTDTYDAVVECVVAGLGFGVAMLSAAEGDHLVVASIAGDDHARETLLGVTSTHERWERAAGSATRVGPTGMVYFVEHGTYEWEQQNDIDAWVPPMEGKREDDGDRPAWDPMDAMFAPLRTPSGELLGVLSVDMPADGLRPGPAQLGLLEMFAVQAAIAIEHAKLHTAVVTAQEENRSALAARLQSLIDASPAGVIEVDTAGVIREWNRAAERLLGYSAAEVVGRPLSSLCLQPPADELALAKDLVHDRHPVRQVQLRRRGGDLVDVELSTASTHGPDGSVTGFMGLLVDITERNALTAELEHRALYDPLTSLGNRVLLTDAVDEALRTLEDDGPKVGVLVVDLDRFKEVNDALGHHHGDLLLKAVAERLRAATRPTDTVARLSADEFAVVLTGVPDVEAVTATAHRIMENLHRSYELEGVLVDVEASIGVAVAPDHATDSAALLRHADDAMHQAKELAAGTVVYAPDGSAPTPMRLALLGDLRRALDRDELVLHYQPKVDVSTGFLAGVEALVRWQHPTRGLLSPAAFLEVAESTGLITNLTYHVLDRAMAQARRWLDDGWHVPVSVNLSARCLHQPGLVEEVRAALLRNGLTPDLLCLELTESAIMADPDRALRTLQTLAEEGVRLSLDDFGTGYSSMSYLRRLPVHELKIDRSFVAEINTGPQDSTLVRSIIELGHTMGLHVVAEGIEDQRTLDVLNRLRCDVAQGYHLARPAPPGELCSWLERAAEVPAAAG